MDSLGWAHLNSEDFWSPSCSGERIKSRLQNFTPICLAMGRASRTGQTNSESSYSVFSEMLAKVVHQSIPSLSWNYFKNSFILLNEVSASYLLTRFSNEKKEESYSILWVQNHFQFYKNILIRYSKHQTDFKCVNSIWLLLNYGQSQPVFVFRLES